VTFGPGVLPTNGVDSLHRSLTTGVNSPTNYAGDTGSVTASPPAVPGLLPWAVGLVAAALLGVGTLVAVRARPTGAV